MISKPLNKKSFLNTKVLPKVVHCKKMSTFQIQSNLSIIVYLTLELAFFLQIFKKSHIVFD
jgi:hypothetical protein